MRAKDGLQDMKRARDILESLCADITTAITDVTARIMPAVLYHGLEELPNDLLTDILVRDSSDDYRRGYRHKELSHVNKRFYSLILSTPSCWSYVDTHGMSQLRNFPIIRKASLPIDCSMSGVTFLSTFLHLKD